MKLVATVLLVAALAAGAPKQTKLGSRIFHRQPMKVEESKPKPHLIGGQDAVPHSIPYAVLVYLFSPVDYLYCGGSLISRNYVLTAASCLQVEIWTLYIYLGTHKFLANEQTEVKLESTYWTIHENYSINDILYNIALIRLPKTIDYTDAIQPIPLPKDPSQHYAGALATVCGWGVRGVGMGDWPDILHYLNVGVVTNEACESYYGPLSSTLLCTGPDEFAGICNGDVGDPLVAEGVLIGVAAFTGIGCMGQASGYTRITTYLDWLKENSDVDI